VLMIRTRRGFLQSHPGRSLLIATLLVVGLTASLPYSPLAPSSASSRSRPSSSSHWGWSCSSTWARPRRPRTSSTGERGSVPHRHRPRTDPDATIPPRYGAPARPIPQPLDSVIGKLRSRRRCATHPVPHDRGSHSQGDARR
jgi:hypothetical protein